jgi:hypothetical protein
MNVSLPLGTATSRDESRGGAWPASRATTRLSLNSRGRRENLYFIQKLPQKDLALGPDGKRIPLQDFFMIDLVNGYRYALRGSGTELTIKFYLFGNAPVTSSIEDNPKNCGNNGNYSAISSKRCKDPRFMDFQSTLSKCSKS